MLDWPLKARSKSFSHYLQGLKGQEIYPYFRPISRSWGTEVEVAGRRLIIIGANDYLGLSREPRIMEAALEAMRRWGTGPGGSRFLCGNLTLHEELEAAVAAFIGGFFTTSGAFSGAMVQKEMTGAKNFLDKRALCS
jgi:7-keto-8-aminopelargonate synthetase-like enzyme